MKANPQIIKFRECPLCGNQKINIEYFEYAETFSLSCVCGLEFGLSKEYQSKSELAKAWNTRHYNKGKRNES